MLFARIISPVIFGVLTVSGAWFNAAPALAAKKHSVIHLNMRFIVPKNTYKSSDVTDWVRSQVRQAEALYNKAPRLNIKYRIEYRGPVGGRVLTDMKFKSGKKLSKYMDKYFDIRVGKKKTSGYVPVLVARSVTVGGKKLFWNNKTKDLNGRAWLPKWINPFSRKHGPVVIFGTPSTFSHELGHMFGLRHTFEIHTNPDPRLRCNKDYKKGSKGQGTTVRSSGRINVMDYNRGTRKVYLNGCQMRRAANQRKKYLTSKGGTHYRRLKGGK